MDTPNKAGRELGSTKGEGERSEQSSARLTSVRWPALARLAVVATLS